MQGQGDSLTPDPVSPATYALVNKALRCYVIPVISALGILGNILAFTVLLLQKRSQVMTAVLVPLSVVDALYLLVSNVDFVQCVVRQFDVIAARNVKILTLPHVLWIGVGLSRISSMLTVVIAAERCLVVLLPLRFKAWVTRKVMYVTAAFACAIPIVAHIPVFLRGEITWRIHPRLNVSLPYLTLTDFALRHADFLNIYKNLVLNVLFRVVPMTTVAICSALTIAQLRRYSAWRSNTATADASVINDQDARITMTLVRVCVVFLVCSLPGAAMLVGRMIVPEFDYYGHFSYSFKTAVDINEFFLCVNSSVNFVIYMRGGDDFFHTFRRICQKTLPACCMACLFRRRMRSGVPSSDTLTNHKSTRVRSLSGSDDVDKKGSDSSSMYIVDADCVTQRKANEDLVCGYIISPP